MKCWLLIFCFAVFPANAHAQQDLPPVYDIKTDTTMLTIDTTFFQILDDSSGDLSLDQVRQSSAFYHAPFYDPTRRSHVYWIRMRVRNTLPYTLNLYLCDFSGSYLDLYWQNANQQWKHERTGILISKSQLAKKAQAERSRLLFHLLPGQETTLYERSATPFWNYPLLFISPSLQTETNRAKQYYTSTLVEEEWQTIFFNGITVGILTLAVCYNLLIYFSLKDRVYLYFSICLFFFILDRNIGRIQTIFFTEYPYLFALARNFFFIIFFGFFVQTIRKFIQPTLQFLFLNRAISYALGLTALANVILFFSFAFPSLPIISVNIFLEVFIRITYLLLIILTIRMMNNGVTDARFALLATTPLLIFWLCTLTTRILGYFFNIGSQLFSGNSFDYMESICFAWLIIVFSGALINRYNLTRQQVIQQAIEREQLEKEREIEKNRLIASQNELLEKQVEERTNQLKNSLENLKATQNQLIQREKMASLGELTAGIAHEIQNPLNFVNNFSEVSAELVGELEEEQQKPNRDYELEADLLGDLKQNLQKITQHGNRASSIVKSMLEHSRTSTGERQATDLNALADEYLRLAYQGLRAKDKMFNCELATNFATNLPKTDIVPQEIGRVLLNLFNNAFYAVSQKAKLGIEGYKPAVSIGTKQIDNQIELRVQDNGIGIPDAVKAKIFQPFFTTKPTGEGTGLGLSLSYDIVTKGHGGTLTVESEPEQGSTFIVRIPTP